MTTGGPKPPTRNPTLPGVGVPGASATTPKAPAAAARPLVSPHVSAPKAPGSSPSAVADTTAKVEVPMSREEIRGVAHAIGKAEAAVFRDELVARLAKIEERLGSLEKKALVSPPHAVVAAPIPTAPITAPLPLAVAVPAPVAVAVPAPVAVAVPAPVAVAAPVPAPVAVAVPAPVSVPVDLASVPVALDSAPAIAPRVHFDTSFDANMDHPFKSSRRRIGVFLIVILVLAVGTIVVAAMISQAMNNHSH